ncbi:TlpA family protein disulfide reductase [Sphingobacterium sp. LRF_L2]|uniref:TlpA family protein disulfide reductase n=1 Tax=Sphingobacterium sp. LRF_L2 TaxID=3369421 RepID=UPI003F63B014
MKNFYKGGRDTSYFDWIFHLFKSKNNRSRTLFSFGICFVLLFSNQLLAQEPCRDSGADGRPIITPIAVGQKLPEEFWSREHIFLIAGDTVRRTLNEYRGKLIVLDFWSSWCKSCVEAFPKLEKLRTYFADDLVFLLPNTKDTRDDLKKIKRAVDNYEDNYQVSLGIPIIVADSTLLAYFPHRMLPHVIWIDRDGTFIAGTGATEVNQLTIDAVMHQEKPSLHLKNDFIALTQQERDELLLFSSSFSGYMEGEGIRGPRLDHDGNFWTYRITNVNLASLLYTAYDRDELLHIPITRWLFDGTVDSTVIQKIRFPLPYEDRF